MRIAIPVWGNRISPVLDVAREILLVDFDQQSEINRLKLPIERDPISERAISLKRNGVDDVLCGAVSDMFMNLLVNQKIKVHPWLIGDVEDVLKAFIADRLSEPCYRMPGCCGQGRGYRRRRGNRTS